MTRISLPMLWLFVLSSASSVHSSVESNIYERSETSCSDGTNYTTPNGLEFNIYCNVEVGGFYNQTLTDADTSSDSEDDYTLEDCMKDCSVAEPACTAVDFNFNTSICYFKNADYTTPDSSSNASSVVHSAIVVPSFLVAENTSCPYDNNTLITSSNGAQFTVDCGEDISWYDDLFSTSYDYPYHTDNLDECIEYCSTAHPLCYGVSWNPDMLYGWANCYLKSAPTAGDFDSVDTYGAISHSAIFNVSNMVPINTTCPSDTTYEAPGGDIFTTKCGSWASTGTNSTSMYAGSFTTCMDSCATSNSSCTAVIFDYEMLDGFNNCYFQTNRGLFLSSGFTHAAYVSKYSNGTTTHSSSTSGKSLGWIAGPVIGVVAAIGLIILGWWWYRSRRQKQKNDALAQAYMAAPPEETYSSHPVSPQDGDTSELPNTQALNRPELPEPIKQEQVIHELQ